MIDKPLTNLTRRRGSIQINKMEKEKGTLQQIL
jgi:hypothetical protein